MGARLSAKDVWRVGPAVAVTLAVFVLSLLPACCFRGVEQALPLFPGADKVVHAAMYAAVVAAWVHAVRPERRRWRVLLRLAAAATLYGLVMEVGQKVLTRTRTMDPLDGCANAAGAFLCAAAVGAWSGRSAGERAAPGRGRDQTEGGAT